MNSPDPVDKLGGYRQGEVEVSNGYKIATYVWEPKCGIAEAKGVIFLFHGIIGHTLFEWLAPDENNYRTLLKGSQVEKLLDLGLVVIGHDHPGHGRSSGLHGYFESFDHVRDAAIDVVNSFKNREDLKGKKTFIMGMSMGGTTTILVCKKRPDLVDGVVLLSPAVRPPDDMFGAYGQFLYTIRPVLGFLVPMLPVLKLPPSPDPIIRDAVSKDGLLYRGKLRVKVGMEFLRVYKEIDDDAESLKFRHIIIFVGKDDFVVSPEGIKHFVERIQCADKKMHVCDSGHEVFTQSGCEPAIAEGMKWLKAHIDT
ncbi:Serine aminopeptidase [Gracilaria domingensis]|nr:Serine aminopeptidase [Gracilaria domingensis]